ncbi:MAG: PEP-CTERM sorting domain-containing protein [Nitrospirae bacterium]|nr:PEP-CTERM sorting domain-containing protein [Nitrospirota bacterium]
MGNGTYNLNAGILSAKNEYLGGSSGTGTFTQTGGTNTVANDLYLSHGSLSGGSGIYTQSGGTNTVGNKLYLGSFTSDSSGSYNLSGGSLSSGYETIGLVGTATFTQSGGINAVSGSLYVGSSSAGGGTYNLSFGSLSTNYEAIGLYSRTGVFTQSGGTHTVTSKLYIGYSSPSSSGTYSISSGSLNVRSFYIGYHSRGTLHITDPAANITVSNLLSFGTDSTFTAVPGATIHMTGSALENISPDPDNLAGLSNLELVFEGGSTDIDPFEVAGQDLGAVMAGFDSNFALGTLTLGGTDIGQVQLIDSFDNQTGWEGSEALYVYNLNLGTGSYLDLNGLNLYYLNGSIDPAATILGGQLTPIPEPSTLILLGAGLVGLVGLRKKRLAN